MAEKLQRSWEPSLSELGTPIRPDLQVEIPFREDYFPPEVEESMTVTASAPEPTTASSSTPSSPPRLFNLSFSFGNPTSAPLPIEAPPPPPTSSPRPPYPRRSSFAQHHRPSASDSTHTSSTRRVSFSIAPLGPTGSSLDIEAFSPPSSQFTSFTSFTFGRPVVALMK